MNRLSIRLGMLFLTMSLVIGAWSPRTITTAPAAHAKSFEYFFYSSPDYYYLGYNSAAGMATTLQSYYGYTVDQYPVSGELVAKGYLTNWIYQAPVVLLYAHLPLNP